MECGIRTDVTPKMLREAMPDTFAKNGKLKKKSRDAFAEILKKRWSRKKHNIK